MQELTRRAGAIGADQNLLCLQVSVLVIEIIRQLRQRLIEHFNMGLRGIRAPIARTQLHGQHFAGAIRLAVIGHGDHG